jgi:hypothetical protein
MRLLSAVASSSPKLGCWQPARPSLPAQPGTAPTPGHVSLATIEPSACRDAIALQVPACPEVCLKAGDTRGMGPATDTDRQTTPSPGTTYRAASSWATGNPQRSQLQLAEQVFVRDLSSGKIEMLPAQTTAHMC